MKFKVIFAIAVGFCMGFLNPSGLHQLRTPDWATEEMGALSKAPAQLPTGSETLFVEWLRSFKLDSPKSWVRVRTGPVAPEGPEQLPTGTEGKAWSLPYPLDQLWAFLTQEDEPQVRAGVAPEGPKKLPTGIEGKAWSLPYPLRELWAFLVQEDETRIGTGIDPEVPKTPPVSEDGKVSSLPYPLDQLWANLTQPYTASWLSMVCETMFLHCMAGIARYLWRNMKKPQGQGRGRTATSPVGTDRWEGGTVSRDHLELLRRLEINTALMSRRQRLLHHRQVDELWRQFSRI